VLRFVAFATVAIFAFVACSSAGSAPGPTTTTSTTTTTIVDDNCERVGADTVLFLDTLIRVLDETRLAEFRDRGAWPDDLVDLERASRDLDIRVAALGCDPESIQQRVLDEANLVPGGPLSEGVIDVLLTPSSSTSTTTTEVVETTEPPSTSTTTDDATTTSSSEATTTTGA